MFSNVLFFTLILLGAFENVEARPPPRFGRETSSNNSTASPAGRPVLSNSSSSSELACRFSHQYSQSDILSDPASFIKDVMYWEGNFHSNSVGYNTANGMTYDGTLLDPTTGVHDVSGIHAFSAASKESLQIMIYAHALSGDPLAATFISPDDPSSAPDTVAAIMRKKLATYQQFNETFPGFGGFLPWFSNSPNETEISPTWDWVNRVPGLDNGELIWAVYAAVQVMEDANRSDWADLIQGWNAWLDYTKATAAKIFYHGDGHVCAVTDLNQTLSPFDPKQNYTCEGGLTATLNDPYEGELFTWWLYFFGGLSNSDNEALWTVKRPQLVAVEYTGSVVDTPWTQGAAANYSGKPVVSKTIGPITVQRGFWFSAHEQWKILEMPYRDVDIVDRVFHNAERVRTCNSVLMGQNAGLFASVNNITDSSGQIIGYISNAGIPSISNQTTQELDIITPYGSFPTVLYNQNVGLAWYKNMLDAKGMQNPYGSSESTRRDGTGVSAFVSWDSKISTVNAILGGVGKFTRKKMQKDNVYDEFKQILNNEYSAVFGNDLKGENVDLCVPDFQVPNATVSDFTQCS